MLFKLNIELQKKGLLFNFRQPEVSDHVLLLPRKELDLKLLQGNSCSETPGFSDPKAAPPLHFSLAQA